MMEEKEEIKLIMEDVSHFSFEGVDELLRQLEDFRDKMVDQRMVTWCVLTEEEYKEVNLEDNTINKCNNANCFPCWGDASYQGV